MHNLTILFDFHSRPMQFIAFFVFFSQFNVVQSFTNKTYLIITVRRYDKRGICCCRVSVCVCVCLSLSGIGRLYQVLLKGRQITRRCVSMCVSVTLQYCIKTAKCRITQITLHNSPVTLVF